MENVAHETEKAISGAIKIDEKEIQDHIDGLVRQSVEDTLNALLNAEADASCNAAAISGHRIGWTPGREAVTESCSPRRARSI